MKMLRKLVPTFFSLVLMLFSGVAMAQGTAGAEAIEMADVLRQDGKIYVVVAVLLTVLAGLLIYLIMIDRKVSRLEKQLKAEGTVRV